MRREMKHWMVGLLAGLSAAACTNVPEPTESEPTVVTVTETEVIYVESDACIECVIEDVLSTYLEENFPVGGGEPAPGPQADVSPEPEPEPEDVIVPAEDVGPPDTAEPIADSGAEEEDTSVPVEEVFTPPDSQEPEPEAGSEASAR